MVMTVRIVAFLLIALSLLAAKPSRPAMPAKQVAAPALHAVLASGPALPTPQTTGPLLHARTYYVSRRGNNLNPGTRALPLRTIQAGINKAYAGDTVMVLAGTYKEQVTFPRSGTEGSPITVRGQVDGQGNPRAIIDNTTPVTATWMAAPEVGTGVYKVALGYTPLMLFVDGLQIVGLDSKLMSGDSTDEGIGAWPGTGLSILGFSISKRWVHPFSTTCSPIWWDAVGANYGAIGETTYIRFKIGDDPNQKNLRASRDFGFNVLLDKDYIKLKHLWIQGSPYPVWSDGANYCVIESCVVRHGYTRIGLNYGSHNVVRDCDLSVARYGATWREWGNQNNDSLPDSSAYSVVQYCISKWMCGDVGCVQLVDEDADEISGNIMHNGHTCVSLRPATNSRVFGNDFSYTSSTAIEQFPVYSGPDSTLVYNNTMTHCDIALRISAIGAEGDLHRRAYIYNNRSWSDSAFGHGIIFHEAANYDYHIQNGHAKSPELWFHHNSFAGGSVWANPAKYACDSVRVINNILNSYYVVGDVIAAEMTDPSLFAAFDYNFLGGSFSYYGKLEWAATDPHNQWPSDSVHGSVSHQVWPLGEKPDWDVPGTSTAYQSGLDLSDSFTIRGIKYGPLPGMTPGYFLGAKPNLGAVQNLSPLGTPERDSRRGSFTRLPELTFAPNPATGKHALVRCAIAAGTVGKLTLHDVLGRTVMSVALVPSAITPQVDLRGFAPGVYIAFLKTPGHSVSRKLVITAR